MLSYKFTASTKLFMIMKNLNQCILGVALSFFALTGCSNEEQLTLDGTSDAKTPLNISVTNAGLTKVGGGSFWQSIR